MSSRRFSSAYRLCSFNEDFLDTTLQSTQEFSTIHLRDSAHNPEFNEESAVQLALQSPQVWHKETI